MSHLYELAFATLEDLQEDLQQCSRRAYFQERFHRAMEFSKQEARVTIALNILQEIAPPAPAERLLPEEEMRLAS